MFAVWVNMIFNNYYYPSTTAHAGGGGGGGAAAFCPGGWDIGYGGRSP